MADYEARSVHADGHFLGSGQAPQAQVLLVWMWEYRRELIRRREVDRIIQARVGSDAALELTGAAIDLAEQLDLQPALVMLNCLGRCEWASEFGDAKEGDRGDKVDGALGDAHERSDLADGLQATAVDRRHAGEIRIKGYRDGGAEDMSYSPDTGRVALSHCPWYPRLYRA
jgi:hypothetical protein